MNINVILVLLCLSFGVSAYAQFCTNDNRFTQVEYFADNQIDSSMDVIYATVNGNEDLAMDIYYPSSTADNLSKRPLILVAHGGGYVAG